MLQDVVTHNGAAESKGGHPFFTFLMGVFAVARGAYTMGSGRCVRPGRMPGEFDLDSIPERWGVPSSDFGLQWSFVPIGNHGYARYND